MHLGSHARPFFLLTLIAIGIFVLGAGTASAALSYSLPSALKKAGCSGDTDADCLDNVEETNLAWAVSPWYFYDEDEDCSGWTNKYGLPSSHFARIDFFQVRPQASNVGSWNSTGAAKWVAITYFLNYPHDCAGIFLGVAGHQGDSESVRFHLYTFDLRTFFLSHAYYAHHGRFDFISGSFLETNARALGTAWASVAADEDSHGSWPGREVSSSHCAGSLDDFCHGFCDCFINTWRSDFQNGFVEFPSASRNVGGPFPESWNPAVLTVSGGAAWSDLNVGHGTNREYWTPRGDAFRKFCGWECPTAFRLSDGNCAVSVHDEGHCADGPLSSKVDTYPFTVGAISLQAPATAPAAAGRAGLVAPAGDPVAAAVPQLAGASREEQLRTLRWMLAVPDPLRLAGLFGDLADLELGRTAREDTALERVRGLAALLESQGVRAPAPAAVPAAAVDDAPAPDAYPAGLVREAESLFALDPDARAFLDAARRAAVVE